MSKKYLLAVVVIAAAGCAVVAAIRLRTGTDTEQTELQTAAAKRGPVRQTVQSTGRVVSNLDVEIKCKASGLVTTIPYDVSDAVKKDDLLVEIDPIDQERALQQAQASLAASEAKLAQARANLAVSEADVASERKRTSATQRSAQAKARDAGAKADREKALLARKQSTVEQAETAETTAIQATQDVKTAEAQIDAVAAMELQLEVRRQEINLAQAQVDADQIAVSLAKQRVSETKVRAPMDGVISARNVQAGQIIASGINNVGGGTAVVTLSDLSRLFILASVDESDIGSVALGQKVLITADAYRGAKFGGEVVRVAAKGVNVSNVVTFEVRIEVTSENKSLLKPEMTANVEIIVAEKADAVTVPARAVHRRDDLTFVTCTLPDGTTEERPVKTGLNTGTDIEILTGLGEGEEVTYENASAESRWRNSGSMPRRMGGPMMMPPPPRGGR